MESACSLLRVQDPTTCIYPEPDQSSLWLPSHFLIIHFSFILQSTPGSSKWSLSLSCPHRNSVCTCSLPIRTTCAWDFLPSHTDFLPARISFYSSSVGTECSFRTPYCILFVDLCLLTLTSILKKDMWCKFTNTNTKDHLGLTYFTIN